MDFKLVFAASADKDLSKLPKKISQRIFKKCQKTKSNPMRYWEKVTDGEEYKLRVGDYRAIADIYFEERKIEVTKVGLRETVYQKLR
jgi:mRNA-degrading endonuclease RelE of RelBE toxin-antitoxin system